MWNFEELNPPKLGVHCREINLAKDQFRFERRCCVVGEWAKNFSNLQFFLKK